MTTLVAVSLKPTEGDNGVAIQTPADERTVKRAKVLRGKAGTRKRVWLSHACKYHKEIAMLGDRTLAPLGRARLLRNRRARTVSPHQRQRISRSGERQGGQEGELLVTDAALQSPFTRYQTLVSGPQLAHRRISLSQVSFPIHHCYGPILRRFEAQAYQQHLHRLSCPGQPQQIMLLLPIE